MKNVAKENLMQLKDLLGCIKLKDYKSKPEILFGATIGQHIRHILEFYLLLVSGSFEGIVSYDKRQRDTRIEESLDFAISIIEKLLIGIDTLNINEIVKFEADYSKTGSQDQLINSSVGRELAYCIEHSIHHQALIKAALIALNISHLTDEHFGVAYSTIRYREK